MEYQQVLPAVFVERPNRFVAICMLEGEQVAAHVKNTGRCRELLTPGAFVFLQYHPAAGRKTHKIVQIPRQNGGNVTDYLLAKSRLSGYNHVLGKFRSTSRKICLQYRGNRK